MLEANISEIQHFCVHDGPGIRTTVFFQGCPLKCKWCHNPEAISTEPVLMYNESLCTGCDACIDGIENCYFLAKKMSSTKMNIDELFKTVMKDEVVYRKSGGGITISGGEPLMQREFSTELLKRFKTACISTAVETAGFVPWETLNGIYEYVDTFLYDLKLSGADKHKEWTGVSNEVIIDNLQRLVKVHNNVVIRIPLIPGVNDSEKEFRGMMRIVSELGEVNGIHILPFHTVGVNKYSMIGEEYTLADITADNEKQVTRCAEIAKEYGIRVSVGGTGFADDKKVG